jgi:dTDP-glucose 4,6-dehydratase
VNQSRSCSKEQSAVPSAAPARERAPVGPRIPPLPRQDLDHILRHTQGLWENLRGSSIFVTGGTGFVGTWLLESLLWAVDRCKLDVSALVLTRDPSRFRERSPHIAEHTAIRLWNGNATAFEFPQGRFPWVIHAAAERPCEPDVDRPLGTFELDVNGTRRVLEFARSHGVRRFLFTSSGAVYGTQPPGLANVPEEYNGAPSAVDAGSAYGEAKRVSEFMCTAYGHVYAFAPLVARLFAFSGAHLPLEANFAMGNFIRDLIGGGPVRIAGDGTPHRSYLYAADLAIWLWSILFSGRPARPYNVGSPQPLTIAELAQTAVRATVPGTRIEIATPAVPGALPPRYVPCTQRAERELGLQPRISLEEGIRRMFDWYRDLEAHRTP